MINIKAYESFITYHWLGTIYYIFYQQLSSLIQHELLSYEVEFLAFFYSEFYIFTKISKNKSNFMIIKITTKHDFRKKIKIKKFVLKVWKLDFELLEFKLKKESMCWRKLLKVQISKYVADVSRLDD